MNKVINNIFSNFRYIFILFIICFNGWMLATSALPFSLENNANVACRILFSSILVMIVPGYLLFNITQIKRRYTLDPFELVVISFGISLIIMEAICVFTVEAGLNSFMAGLLLIILSAVLMVWNFVKESKSGPEGVDIKPYALKIWPAVYYTLFIIAIIATAILLYKIESPISTSEDQIHISVIRKMLENSHIMRENIFYKPDIAHTYLYPGLHFIIALISRFSLLDPIIVYAKLRFILGALSLLVIWTFSKTLFKSAQIAFTITFTCLALIYNGIAGKIPGLFCAQLIPVSHTGDISMGLFLPLALIFSFKYILDEKYFNRFFIFSVLLIAATIVIHVREGIQVVFYYAVTACAYLIFNRQDKKTILKIFMLLVAVVLFGKIYQYIHSVRVSNVKEIEQVYNTQIIEIFKNLLGNFHMAFSTPENYPDIKALVPAGMLVFKRYLSMAIPFSLLILLLFRRTFWGLFFSSSILVSLLFMRFNIFAVFLMICTYSEIMFTPARFVLYFSYIIFGLIIYSICIGFDILACYVSARFKLKKLYSKVIFFILVSLLGYLFSHFLLLNFVTFMQEALYWHGSFLLIFMLLVVFAVMLHKGLSKKIANFQDYFMTYNIKYRFLNLVALFVILYVVYKNGGGENPRVFTGEQKIARYSNINIFDAYKTRITTPDITDFKNYCQKTDILNCPYDVMEFIRNKVPSGNKFVANIFGEKAVFIPTFANQYVAVVPVPDDPDFVRIKNLDHDYLSLCRFGYQIIFNDTETDHKKLDLIYKFKLTYILLEPPFYHLEGIFSRYGCLEKVYDNNNYLIYKVDRQKLKEMIGVT